MVRAPAAAAGGLRTHPARGEGGARPAAREADEEKAGPRGCADSGNGAAGLPTPTDAVFLSSEEPLACSSCALVYSGVRTWAVGAAGATQAGGGHGGRGGWQLLNECSTVFFSGKASGCISPPFSAGGLSWPHPAPSFLTLNSEQTLTSSTCDHFPAEMLKRRVFSHMVVQSY